MSNKQTLLDKISSHRARIGVVGLGYVGLPLAVEFAAAGFRATGFEVDAEKVDNLNRGVSYIPDVTSAQLAAEVSADRLHATTDFTALGEVDIIIICVPTPLRKTKEPDVSYILSAAEKIRKALRPGHLIILESTTYPGTTDEVLRPMFDETGKKIDEDYFLAFSPERIDPGNERFNTRNIPKVVGGVTADSTDVAAAAYGEIVDTVHRVSSARVAEACKLLENTYRAVNIGLVNELAQLCYTLGIDTWEVIGAAATKPFGFMPFYPGPGIGGHCLVGDEMIVVRSIKDGRRRLETLADLFVSELGRVRGKKSGGTGSDIVFHPKIEVLSLDQEKQLPQWKPVSHMFRRQYSGRLVTILTSDNRRLTVTDRHPMLVCGEDGKIIEVAAENLAVGDRLPVYEQPVLTVGGSGALDRFSTDSLAKFSSIGQIAAVEQIAAVPVKSIEIRQTTEPVMVYSVEVEGTHTFATSYGIFVHNCIPLDPHYLSWKARMHGFEARFISLAEEINSRMPEHVVELITDGLNSRRKAVNGARILILGVAYKRDIDDVRESPALAIIERLRKRGGEVVYHDPYIPEFYLDGEGDELMQSVELTEELVAGADCVVIVTDHRRIDYRWVVERARLVVDTRNATRPLSDADLAAKIIRL